jgi:hypothetical protein
MLTIKHVECDGYESVRQASHVERYPLNADAPGVIAYGVPGEAEPLRFASGTVYVMGDGGKTVATYSLGGNPSGR